MRLTRLRLRTGLAALVGAVAMLSVACGGGDETAPIKLVPEGSNLVAEVNVTGLLNSKALATIVEPLLLDADTPRSLDDLLDEAGREIGFDVRQISTLTIFGDISRGEEFFGVIVRGSFEEDTLIASLQQASGDSFTTEGYKGRRLYTSVDDADKPGFVLLKSDILVLGGRDAVRAVIDVQAGDRDRLGGPVADSFKDLGSGLVKLAVDVSDAGLADRFTNLGQVPFLGGSTFPGGIENLPGVAQAVADLELIGFSLSQNGSILALRANFEFSSEDSATSIGEFAEGLLALGRGLIPDAEIVELLDHFKVTRAGTRLYIRFEISASEVSELVSKATGITSTESSRESKAVEEAIRVPRIVGSTEEQIRVPPAITLGEEVEIMPTSSHVPQGQTVEYSTMPPTSGDHWEIWADCGFYPEGLPDEVITHNLEHGNIVISYNLKVPGQIAGMQFALEAIDGAADWGVFRRYDKLPEGTVALSAWGRLDIMEGVDLPRITQFFGLYTGRFGPERIPCSLLR